MNKTFGYAKTQLTDNSALAFKYIKDMYGSNAKLRKDMHGRPQLVGPLGAFQRLIPFARSELNNAMGDVERLSYRELLNKLQAGIDVYQA